MPEYVSRCRLEVNGQTIEDFKSVSVKEIELHKAVNLMSKTGIIKLTPRYAVAVDYVVPEDTSEFNWEEVTNGTLTNEYENGKRETFTGVYIGKVGEKKVDGENETVRTIELIALGRAEE